MKGINEQAQDRARGYRDPSDGEPFYCTFCGSGLNEYGACEEVKCRLETKDEAMKRFKSLPAPIWPVGDYSDIMDE